MVYGFVRRCNGHMTLESEPNIGTKICLYFPRSFEESSEASDSNEQVRLPRGNETVLVVDDEADMADVAIAHLNDLGYTALVAHDADQALDVLDSVTKIDLLFADVIMPGSMDGNDLANAAQRLYPELKVLLTSGYAKKQGAEDAPDAAMLYANLLQKPYNKSTMSVAVRNALDD